MRGYKISKKYEDVYIKLRMTNNFDYFDHLKSKIFQDSQVKIAYYWKKYLKKKMKKKIKT